MATSTPSKIPSDPGTAKAIKPKRRKLIIILLVVLFVLAGAGAAAVYFLTDYFKPATPVPVVKPLPADPIYVALQPFTVNLRPDDRLRMLHAVVTLQVADAKSQILVAKYLPLVHGLVLSVLSNRQSATLLTKEDRDKLALEVKTVLNQPFAPNLPIANISKVELFPFMLQ